MSIIKLSIVIWSVLYFLPLPSVAQQLTWKQTWGQRQNAGTNCSVTPFCGTNTSATLSTLNPPPGTPPVVPPTFQQPIQWASQSKMVVTAQGPFGWEAYHGDVNVFSNAFYLYQWQNGVYGAYPYGQPLAYCNTGMDANNGGQPGPIATQRFVLASPIDNAQTVIPTQASAETLTGVLLADDLSFPGEILRVGPVYIQVEDEFMEVKHIDTLTGNFTVVRGALGSTPAPHSNTNANVTSLTTGRFGYICEHPYIGPGGTTPPSPVNSAYPGPMVPPTEHPFGGMVYDSDDDAVIITGGIEESMRRPQTYAYCHQTATGWCASAVNPTKANWFFVTGTYQPSSDGALVYDPDEKVVARVTGSQALQQVMLFCTVANPTVGCPVANKWSAISSANGSSTFADVNGVTQSATRFISNPTAGPTVTAMGGIYDTADHAFIFLQGCTSCGSSFTPPSTTVYILKWIANNGKWTWYIPTQVSSDGTACVFGTITSTAGLTNGATQTCPTPDARPNVAWDSSRNRILDVSPEDNEGNGTACSPAPTGAPPRTYQGVWDGNLPGKITWTDLGIPGPTFQECGATSHLSYTQSHLDFSYMGYWPAHDALVMLGAGVSNSLSSWELTLGGSFAGAALTPNLLSFGNQVTGTSSTAQSVTLINSGNAALTVTSITAPTGFAQTNNCPMSPSYLAVGANCTIDVTFTPTATQAYSGNLVIADNAGSGTQTKSLTGNGIAANTPVTSLTQSSLTFNSQIVGTTSAGQALTLSNTGSAPLSVSNIQLAGTNPGDYALTTTPALNCGGSIAVGGSCAINVTFQPTAAGTRTGSITITDNASDSPQTIGLTGTGTLPVSLSPGSVTFPSRVVGTTSAATSVALTNNQSTTLAITGVSVAGDFAQTNTCGGSVKTNSKCTFNVTFTPTTTGTRTGSVTITDTANNSPQVISLSGTGTAVQLVSIAVTPNSSSLPLGGTMQFKAKGNYNNGTTQDLTNSVVWSSANVKVATVNSTGMANSVGQGVVTIKAVSGMISGTTALTVTAPVLMSISIAPANPTISLTTNQQFTATGSYSNNTTQNLTNSATWSSSNTRVASVGSTGLATSNAQGSTTITATYGTVSGSTTLTVAAPALVSITITPANPFIAFGTTQQLTATGTYSDGSTQNLTGSATWNSSDSSVASIGNTGLANSLAQGSTIISATSGSTSGSTILTVGASVLVSIAITPANPSIALGTAQQFTATGTYSDGSTLDITAQAVWNSSSSNASVSNAIGTEGLTQSVTVGSSGISATLNTITGSTLLTITPASLVSLAVSPTNPTVAQGLKQQFTAIGTFTDGSTQDLTATATWNSSSPGVATISNAFGTQGQATAAAQGSTNITAASASVVSNTAILMVQAPALTSITVNPPAPSIALGMTQQFTATGIYTDGSTQDLTASVVWSSSSTSIASISNTMGRQGLASGTGQGSTTITATSASVSGNTLLTITPAIIVSIALTPATATIPLGATQQFTATATFSDQSTQDVTGTVHWAAGIGDIATISNSPPTQGLATSVAAGNVSITASSGGVTGSASLMVSPATLDSIAVTPANISIAAGTQQQFRATGTYSDNSTQDLTALVNWTTSPGGIANISNASGSQGMASAVSQGVATVIATSGPISGSTALTVTAATLVSITVAPVNPTISLGITQQFTTTGTYSDGSTEDLTNTVQWSTDNASVASVNATGLATSLSTGNVTVTATLSAVAGSTTLVVSHSRTMIADLRTERPWCNTKDSAHVQYCQSVLSPKRSTVLGSSWSVRAVTRNQRGRVPGLGQRGVVTSAPPKSFTRQNALAWQFLQRSDNCLAGRDLRAAGCGSDLSSGAQNRSWRGHSSPATSLIALLRSGSIEWLTVKRSGCFAD